MLLSRELELMLMDPRLHLGPADRSAEALLVDVGMPVSSLFPTRAIMSPKRSGRCTAMKMIQVTTADGP
jgi:hypothetical protein